MLLPAARSDQVRLSRLPDRAVSCAILSMSDEKTTLTTSTTPLQQSIIKTILEDEGIDYSIRDRTTPSVILGEMDPLGYIEFCVAP